MNQLNILMMKSRKHVIFPWLTALLLSSLHPAAHAGQSFPCWIQHIEDRDGKLYISFLPNYRQRAFISNVPQERQNERSAGKDQNVLVMLEGETANIGDGLHSGCSMSAERHDQQLGLQVRAYLNFRDLVNHDETRFIPAVTGQEP